MAIVVSKAQSNEVTALVCLVLQVQCLDQIAPNLRFDLSMIFIINTEGFGASSTPTARGTQKWPWWLLKHRAMD